MLRLLRTIADRPVTIFVLIAYFILDLYCISGTGNKRHDTVIGHLLTNVRGDANNVGLWAAFECSTDGECAVSDQIANEPSGIVHVRGNADELGIYAPTHVMYDGKSQIESAFQLSVKQTTQLWRQAIQLWDTQGRLTLERRRAFLSHTPPGSIVSVTYSPLGYLHNTLSLFMFVMLCWSLRLNIPKLWRERDPTKCPKCGYSIVGLTTATCPECGGRLHMEPRP